uniref:Bacillosamine/Legionaminic acid biosynthesis aminotransferase PglE 4-keto-6-deoxy-N-Acetyl-D-hexosaminyl-(Lipid carrier) aminotransferase n=1 Tax=Rheinheimera sp. BAL341 TaxID=1708203 RepID=A0A486XXV4_9GAMM
MHTFGHPADLESLLTISLQWQIMLIEDAAESLGSLYKTRHTGTFGQYGVFSFNGNKIITTGGGGMVLCADPTAGQRLKHLTTTAKLPHSFEFEHNEYGFNYRMPNLNAALGCAQMEQLEVFIANKRATAGLYAEYFAASDFKFVTEPQYARSNYWLNAVICPSETAKQQLLAESSSESIMLRPAWKPMHTLNMYHNCIKQPLPVTELIANRLVNLPSSMRILAV